MKGIIHPGSKDSVQLNDGPGSNSRMVSFQTFIGYRQTASSTLDSTVLHLMMRIFFVIDHEGLEVLFAKRSFLNYVSTAIFFG